MRPSCCRSCLAFLLKLLNFFQTFVGISILIYSIWLLNQTTKHGFNFSLDLDKLPAPWFVCFSMGIGILLCLVAITGHIAAETISSCCLCFGVINLNAEIDLRVDSVYTFIEYAVFVTIIILLEAALVGYVIFNKDWMKDLPPDSTGELKRLIALIKDNKDIVRCTGVCIVVIQTFSLLLAVLVRAMIPSRRVDYDSDEEYFVIRRPLITQPATQTLGSASGFHSDSWSLRMKQKYGLNPNLYAPNAVDTKVI